MQTVDRTFLKRERAFVFVFTGLMSMTTAHFVRYGWDVTTMFARITVPPPPPGSPPPQLYAPVAYRVLMPTLVHWIARMLPRADGATIFAGMDCAFLWVALCLIYLLAVRGMSAAAEFRSERTLRIALTFLLAVTALTWFTQYQRPETAPTALYLALSALSLRRRSWWPVLVQLGWTVLQGFTRADVGLLLGVAMVAASLFRTSSTRTSRSRLLVQGLATAAISVGVQAYLQFVRFPHLTYDPQTPVFQVRNNLLLHMWGNALIAICPIWLPIVYAWRTRRGIVTDEVATTAVFAAALYLPLWFAVGSLAEVRIYIPFLLLIAPVAARAVGLVLGNPAAHEAAEPRDPLYE